MKFFLLAAILLTLSACSQGNDPIRITAVNNCDNDFYGRQTCQVSYQDGDTGYLIRDYNQGASYSCRKGGL